MADELLQYAQVGPSGVGGYPGPELLIMAAPAPPPVDPRTKPVRRRPNNGRQKRTDRHPLSEPPMVLLRALGIPLPAIIENLPTTPRNWRIGGRADMWRAGVRAMWGTTCHLCGHGEAYSADHLIPLSVWSNQPYDPALARPAHGVIQPGGGEGCPTCHVKCNSSRGNQALALQIANYRPAIEL